MPDNRFINHVQGEIETLERWIREVESGVCSTNLVEQMKARVSYLKSVYYRLMNENYIDDSRRW